MRLSIIIPTYNEEASIQELLHFLLQCVGATTEIIVADGNSSDATCTIVQQMGVRIIACKHKGRAPQMNEAAAVATGNVLYFLHADTFPPSDFEQTIAQAVVSGYSSGCFRLRFDKKHWFLQANAWFTRFNVDAVRFGDQSLFVRKDLFIKTGGFNQQLLLLEDQEIIPRLRRAGTFIVLPAYVITSARKYREVGVFKLQGGYFLIYLLYKAGVRQEKLVQAYKWLIQKRTSYSAAKP